MSIRIGRELVCEHIAGLAAFAKARGARAMMWHDMLGWSHYGGTPQSDVMFDRALRMVGRDMKIGDYRDTGHVSWQVTPEWWLAE